MFQFQKKQLSNNQFHVVFIGGFKNTFTKVSKSTEVQKKDNSKTEKSEPTAGEFKLVFFDYEFVSQSYKPKNVGALGSNGFHKK